MKARIRLCPGVVALLLALAVVPASAQTVDISVTDFDGSGRVDFTDFIQLAQAFGTSQADAGFNATYDLDGDGAVAFGDFVLFARNFGRSASESTASFIYIADTASGEVRAFNTANNLQDPARRISVSTPQGMAIGQITGHIYVSALDTFHAFSSDGRSLFQLPITDEADLGFMTSRGGSKVVLADNDQLAFVSETAANVVEVFDLLNNSSIGLIPVAANPTGIATGPEGNRVYVAHGSEFATPIDPPISVVNVASRSVIDTISAGGATINRLVVHPDGSRLYANDVRSSVIQVFDPSSGDRIRTIDVATDDDLTVQLLDIAIGATGQKLYAAATRTILGFDTSGNPTPIVFGDLVVVDLATSSVVSRVNVGQIAANLAVSPDESKAYVSGVEDPNDPSITVIIVDLETATKAGILIGFELPSDLEFAAGKPTVSERIQAALALH